MCKQLIWKPGTVTNNHANKEYDDYQLTDYCFNTVTSSLITGTTSSL